MADLNPLIRLRKYRVEEKQKVLAELFRQAELLEARKRTLLGDIAREEEIALASDAIDAYVTFAAYAARVQTEVENINQGLARLDARIVKAQEEMREAFSEQKKVEIIQRNRDAEEAAKEAQKESNTLDEVGIEVFRRKEENE